MLRPFLTMALICLPAVADTIELTTGEKVNGKFKQATDSGAVIELGGQALTFPLSKVRAIYLGEAPVTTQVGRSQYEEALDALQSLRSVTNSGISYRDYAPRVLDARVKVDKYLALPNQPEKKQSSIKTAMQYYELAGAAWGGEITKNYSRATEVGLTLRGSAELGECPNVQQVIAESNASSRRIHTQAIGPVKPIPPRPGKTLEQEIEDTAITFTGSNIGRNPALLWSCATTKLDSLEKPAP
jgi:hypothetical protein